MDSFNVNWKGTALNQIPTCFSKPQYPDINASLDHTVLIKLPFVKCGVPQPYESKCKDIWSENHVRLPSSKHNLYSISPRKNREKWELIKKAFLSSIFNSHQFEAAVLSYNPKYSDNWNFSALHAFFTEVCDEEESLVFFVKIFPKIVKLALNLPEMVRCGVPLLKRHINNSITFSQMQVASLLANAFLCTFPRRNTTTKSSEYSNYPTINFNRLFQRSNGNRSYAVQEKLKCIIHYFNRVTSDNPTGLITYSRYFIPESKLPEWKDSKEFFKEIHVSSSGTIENDGIGMFQMDFANKLIGGGVLATGAVQEEIRFVICPELMLARLFTEVLDNTEVLVVTGCERFSRYKGYGNLFTWAGDYIDTTPSDEYGRKYCTIIAADALSFGARPQAQFTIDNIRRELNKAYTAFSWGSHYSFGELCGVATGNWGCGAYRGDLYLKALLQLMASAQVRRPLVYYTFENNNLRDSLYNLHKFLQENYVTVGTVWELLCEYSVKDLYKYNANLYKFICQAVLDRNISDQICVFTMDDWMGIPISQIQTSYNKPQYPEVKLSDFHTVLVKLPFVEDEIPVPYEAELKDFWSENYVRLPCSEHSLYSISLNETRKRWEVIKEAYLLSIVNSHQFETAVLSYNSEYKDTWNFSALHKFFSEVNCEEIYGTFFEEIFPKIVKLALNLPQLLLCGIPLLKRHVNHSITLSQMQVASLLANAFLCTFPKRNADKRSLEHGNYPTINFNRLFQSTNSNRDCVTREKIKYILHYFRRVTSDNPTGLITYSRYFIPSSELPEWKNSKKLFKQIHVSTSRVAENSSEGMLQIDFSHKLIGGGVLTCGAIQQDIRFMISPELLLSRLFTEVLDDTEVLVVTGYERFNEYKDIGNSFIWTGNYTDKIPSDEYGRKYRTVVLRDALTFGKYSRTQFNVDNIQNELNKTYTGFSWGSSNCFDESCDVISGNWTYDAHEPSLCLNALLQLMASSQTNRSLVFFTSGNDKLRDDLYFLHKFLQDNNITVGTVWKLLCEYMAKECYTNNVNLYEFIYREIFKEDIPKLFNMEEEQ